MDRQCAMYYCYCELCTNGCIGHISNFNGHIFSVNRNFRPADIRNANDSLGIDVGEFPGVVLDIFKQKSRIEKRRSIYNI